MESAKVGGVLGQVYGDSPSTFFLNLSRKYDRAIERAFERAAERLDFHKWREDIGSQYVEVPMGAGSSSAPQRALKLALWFVRHPDVISDELVRISLGIGKGTGDDTELLSRVAQDRAAVYALTGNGEGSSALVEALPQLRAHAGGALEQLFELARSESQYEAPKPPEASSAEAPPDEAKAPSEEPNRKGMFFLGGLALLFGVLLFAR